jgi:hypothetical protein
MEMKDGERRVEGRGWRMEKITIYPPSFTLYLLSSTFCLSEAVTYAPFIVDKRWV